MGVRTIMEDLLSVITHNTDAPVCTAGVLILHTFCANTTEDVSDYLPQLFRGLIGLFARTDEKLILAAWNCLDAIAKVGQIFSAFWITIRYHSSAVINGIICQF